MPIQFKILIGIVVTFIIFSFGKMMYNGTTQFYNSHVSYTANYDQYEQDQITTFDNNYLIFKDQTDIADVSKETFIHVTEIIMSNRHDGKNLAWKWVKENQNIDYNQFTKFYIQLTDFTRERYKENNEIERKKQEIVKLHKFMLSSFPGVIYNKYLPGFITKETKKLFYDK